MIRRLTKALFVLVAFLGAAFAGYVISSSLEQTMLKAEAEKQLSALLHGSVQIGQAHLALRGGLFLEGENVGAYPSDSAPHQPRLFARKVYAEIDVTALLAGTFRLSGLTLEDVTFRIERHTDGRWEPSPVEALAENNRKEHPNPMEKHLGFLGAFEDITRTLLSKVILADRFVIQNGRVILTDHSPPTGTQYALPIHTEIKQVNGRIVHHWLSGVVDLRVAAAVQTQDQRSTPLRVEGSHNGGGDLEIEVAAHEFALDRLAPYIALDSGKFEISGLWQGHFHYETHRLKHGALTTNGTFSDLNIRLPVANGVIQAVPPQVDFSVQMRIEPEHAWLEPAVIEVGDAMIRITGDVERPLSEESNLALSGHLSDLNLGALRGVLEALPKEDSATIEKLLERAESGLLQQARGEGTAPIGDWKRLLSGPVSKLPSGFVVAADLAGVSIRTGNDGLISDLAGTIEVSQKMFSLLDVKGNLNQSPLPSFNVRIHDFSNLMESPQEERDMLTRVPELPGIPAFFELFRPKVEDAEEPIAAQPDIILRIDHLEYPLFAWPIRDAFVRVSGVPGGSKFDIKKGFWAGVPFWGGAVWTHESSDVLDFEVWTGPYENSLVTQAVDHSLGDANTPDPSEDKASESTWAQGRFEIPRVTLSELSLDRMRGFILLAGQTLSLLSVRADLEPTGKFLGGGTFNLGQIEEVPSEIKLSLVSADIRKVGESVGFAPDFATGQLHLSGELKGSLRPQTPLLTDLRGDLNLKARDGELQTSRLPLLVALAQTTEGYNDSVQRDSIAYEALDALLHVEDGLVSTNNLELEGPLRIYASGTIDVTHPPNEMIGVVGLFIFRGPGQVMENIPLAKAILPGSEKGLLGAYYQVDGTFDNPEIDPLRRKSISEDLPEVLVAPYAILSTILTGKNVDHGQTVPDPRPSPPLPPTVEPPPDVIQEESTEAPDEEKTATQATPESHTQEIKPGAKKNNPQPAPSGATIETSP